MVLILPCREEWVGLHVVGDGWAVGEGVVATDGS
jgi:hypothetical protein